MRIEARLEARGLVLPEVPQVPLGLRISFAWARIRGIHVYLSGHPPQAPDRSLPGPFGKVPWRFG